MSLCVFLFGAGGCSNEAPFVNLSILLPFAIGIIGTILTVLIKCRIDTNRERRVRMEEMALRHEMRRNQTHVEMLSQSIGREGTAIPGGEGIAVSHSEGSSISVYPWSGSSVGVKFGTKATSDEELRMTLAVLRLHGASQNPPPREEPMSPPGPSVTRKIRFRRKESI